VRPALRVRPPVLYAIAFVLMTGAGIALVASVRGFLESTRLQWFSMALSVAAIVAAVINVVWRPREP
jgi:xanthine/uracil permease